MNGTPPCTAVEHPGPLGQVWGLAPGLLLAMTIAWLAIVSSRVVGTRLMGFEKSPVSSVMVALLLGMLAGNFLQLPGWLTPGLRFASRTVLRLGIVLLGIRLSILDVLRLGALGIPIVVVCITGALLFTTALGRLLGLPKRLGILIAVGTSICGVSAIGATGPAIEASEEEITYAVAVITLFGILATFLYPYLARLVFQGDAVRAGLFLGTAIHDTSQVVGAGLVYSELFTAPAALKAAVVCKLVRNAFMTLVIPLLVLSRGRKTGQGPVAAGRLFPRFLVGFLLLAAVRSVGDAGLLQGGRAFGLLVSPAWTLGIDTVQGAAGNCLVAALAAVGVGTRLRTMKSLGLMPLLAGVGAATAVGLLAVGTILLLGNAVRVGL